MRENELQRRCREWLAERGIWHINVHQGGWTGYGAPDLLICARGRFVAAELKVGENDLSPAQAMHRNRIIRSGGVHIAPYTLEEFIEHMEEIGW